jgi:hypothetical protein
MSLSDWVQLFRNAFCVVRSVAPKESFIFKVPFPHSKLPLTWIDFGVASMQLPAIYFFASGGVRSLYSSYEEVRKYKKLITVADRHRFHDIDANEAVGPELVSAVLRHGLAAELQQARRQFKVGVCQLLISAAFVLFSLNTLQVRLSRHPMSVINGVVLMLAGLSYLLYTMVLTMWSRYTSAVRARKLKKRLRNSSNGNSLEEIVNLTYRAGFGENLMDALVALTAAHDSGEPQLTFQHKDAEISDYEAVVESDLETIGAALSGLRDEEADAAAVSSGTTPRRHTRSKARAASAESQAPTALLRALDAHILAQHRSLGLTAAFFLLNAAAGYGYLMPVLAYYLPHEKQPSGSVVGALLKLAMFTLPSSLADWRGNMVGDVAWTLEPLLVLAAPTLLQMAQKVALRVTMLLGAYPHCGCYVSNTGAGGRTQPRQDQVRVNTRRALPPDNPRGGHLNVSFLRY